MFIQTEETPNPASLKFIPGVDVMTNGTAEFRSAAAAGNSPLAQNIFAVDGVAAQADVELGPVAVGEAISETERPDRAGIVFYGIADAAGLGLGIGGEVASGGGAEIEAVCRGFGGQRQTEGEGEAGRNDR